MVLRKAFCVSEIILGPVSYGKSAIRIMKVDRADPRHVVHDLNVDVQLSGDFAAAYVGPDNTQLLATDTMRNTVYALASQHPLDSLESFGIALAQHFLSAGPTVTQATVTLTEYPWRRIAVDGHEHDHSFTREAGERTATVVAAAAGVQISAGVDGLMILKTTNSGWEQFYQERYTVLPDTNDRILATLLTATWRYAAPVTDYSATWADVRAQILTSFTDHYSPSVQHTLYRMGHAVLERFAEIAEISFTLPNKHHLLFDLKRFGLENPNTIFQVTQDPFGLISGTVTRRGAA